MKLTLYFQLRKAIAFLLLMSCNLSLFAFNNSSRMYMQQSNASFSGKVVDENGGALPGASVFVASLNLGVATDLNGLFNVPKIPQGTYTLTISYLGYEPYEQQIELDGDLHLLLGIIELVPQVNQLGSVTVTASLEGQQKALNQQRTADNIKSIVSADLIGRFPDINVGEAMQRVSGVSIGRNNGEGSTVRIRGTPSNFTTVSINGEQIPTTNEGGGRAESLDLIAADQLASMEVSKAITPDMDGDAVGGAINLITPTAASSKARVSGSLGGGYNNLFGRGSQVYRLKFDKRTSDDKFGILVGGSFYNTVNGEERFEAAYRERRIGASDDPNAFMANVIDDYRLRPLENERTRVGVNATFDYKFNENSNFVVKAIYNKLEDVSLRRRTRFRPRNNYQDPLNPNLVGSVNNSDVRIRRDINDRVIDRENITLTFEGEHLLFNFAKIDYAYNFTRSERQLFSDRFVFEARGLSYDLQRDGDFVLFNSPGFDQENLSLYTFSGFQQDLPILNRGDNQVVRLNLTFPLTLGNAIGEIKTGGKLRFLDNLRRRNTVEYGNFLGPYNLSQIEDGNQSSIFDGRYATGGFPSPERAMRHFMDNAGAYVFDTASSKINNDSFFFDASENVSAAFIQGKLQFDRFRVLAGVRYEHTDVTYDALELDAPGGDDQVVTSAPITGFNDYDFLLPMVHLKYELNNSSNLRFAYTKSFARPELQDVVPTQNINFADQIIQRGNASLIPATANNLDVLFESYLKGAGVVSGGLFYKKIDNFIFNQIRDITEGNFEGFRQFSAVNGDVATILGAEFNFSKKLDFLPGFLSGLSVFMNYTYTQSDSSFEFLDDSGNTFIREDVPFVGQADHIWNAALAYDLGGFSIRTSLNYNGRALSSFADNPELDFFLEERYQLDINASQKINKNLTVFAEFVNLTNDPVIQFQSIRSQITNYEIYDWSARFGINFKF